MNSESTIEVFCETYNLAVSVIYACEFSDVVSTTKMVLSMTDQLIECTFIVCVAITHKTLSLTCFSVGSL